MGEEEKKTEEKKVSEEAGKKGDEGGKAEKKDQEEEKPDKIQIQNQGDDKKRGGEDGKEQAPPPPPQEIVLKVYMHCEGCARKVRRSLKGFDGVEDVITDCKSHKVVVKGEKADPLKVLDRVQRKSHLQVELLSPIPKPQPPEPPKEEKEPPTKAEDKKEEPKVITVVLKVHMHCEACSQEIKKRILRMKGVESAEADLRKLEVSVKGVFEPQKLVEYVYKRTGKHAVIVNQDPPPEKKEEDQKAKDDQKKGEEGGGDQKKKAADPSDQEQSKESGGKDGEEAAEKKAEEATEENAAKIVELKKNEYCNYYPAFYPPKYAMDVYSASSSSSYYQQHPAVAAYPPQLFSDENPNACSVM